MQGKRVENFDEAKDGERYIPGCYWPGRTLNDGRIEWWIVDPKGMIGALNPGRHQVTEHEDGTITVSPSIVSTIPEHGHDYHGWLERGVWRDA